MPSTTIYVTGADDDGRETSSGETLLNEGAILINVAGPVGGTIFRSIPVPPGATVSTALYRFVLVGSTNDTPNLEIRGEIHPTDFTGVDFELSTRSKTSERVVWEDTDIYPGAGVYASSPNLAAVIQEIIGYEGWAEDDDLALFLIDRNLGGVFEAYEYDFGPGTYPPGLFLEWTVPVVSGELDYGWPGDYWPDEYFAEYWPDYGTGTPPGSMGPVGFMHLQRMHRRSSL